MTKPPLDLTLVIRSEDGSSAEFFQEQEDCVNRILRMLANPRLFSQPLLMLASPHNISAIPCRTIDMILASTLAPVTVRWPTGFLEVVEVAGPDSNADALVPESTGGDSAEPADATTFYIQIYTLGSWGVTLKVKAAAQATVQDKRLLLAHFLDLPVLPFRLAAGGMGFINPAKINRVTGLPPVNVGGGGQCSALEVVPDTALPAELLRWAPLFPRTKV